MLRKPSTTRAERRGVVAVEFAIVAPLLLAITLGVLEINRALDAQNTLEVAAREGARFAALDRDGIENLGQAANEKLINDVKNYLASNGVPRDAVSVSVTHADDPTAEFLIDDPVNDLALFQVEIEVDYSAVSLVPVQAGSDYTLTAAVVFRNGTATISD